MSKPEASKTPITETIDRLRHLSQVTVQAGWHVCDVDLSVGEVCDSKSWQSWDLVEPNAKGHLAWAKGQQIRWFVQKIVVPPDLNDYPLQGLCLRLALTWWAELAQVFVDGELVQEGDLFDCSTRLLLSPKVSPGDPITVAIRLVSPSHDDGALVRSVCLYETLAPDGFPEPGFIADELEVLHRYLQAFYPEKLPFFENAIAALDWSTLSPAPLSPTSFTTSLVELRDLFLPLSPLIKQRTINLLGHAHLDLAWLWGIDETWRAAERTFESVLKLQDEFPELIFCHSTPALYEWMEHNRPDLFYRITQQVAAGRWEPIGGIWVEPELNIISGESIARQILYGQRYYQEKFGKTSQIAWLPDTFGFSWQLPQFLKQGGIDYFVTQKLRWNDTTQFPYELFQWQAPDGTQVLSLMSAPIGEGIDPIKMATYACDWEQKTGIPISLWLPGVGDHGGGPTRDMLQLARRWGRSPFFPNLEFTTAEGYLHTLEETLKPAELEVGDNHSALPVWNSDLYLEFHRGCYTTNGDIKRCNRSLEHALYQAEVFCSLATIVLDQPYPQAELETIRKNLLFSQFHDILPGSSISEVYDQILSTFADDDRTLFDILSNTYCQMAHEIAYPPPPHPDAMLIVVFNSLAWVRSETVMAPVMQPTPHESPVVRHWRVYDMVGEEIPSYFEPPIAGESLEWNLFFQAEDIPGVGYRCFWICPDDAPPCLTTEPVAQFNVLENEYLRATIDPDTGLLVSLFDKVNQREGLRAPGNQIQIFQDKGQYWDAWNIDPSYAQHPLPAPTPSPLCRNDSGVLVQRIELQWQVECGEIRQTYCLEKGSDMLKIETAPGHRDELLNHRLLKLAFSLNLDANDATYEIPCGAIDRTTRPQTAQEKAQWEVPALHWADLSNDHYGVSLLNNCKYGYDSQPDQIRLTLTRTPTWPSRTDWMDLAHTCAIYPHPGRWSSAKTVRRGYELHHPLDIFRVQPQGAASTGTLPTTASLLNLGADNLVLTAFKQAEATQNQWILRCYECHGETTELELHSDLGLTLQHPVDLLEDPIDVTQASTQMATVQPWQIVSFAVSVDR